jgi:SAM-dependent methyltransferase
MKKLGALNPEVLGLLASLWESEAEAMLDRIGLAPGASCIDLGCGAAGILRPLSVIAGAAGRVVGLESDPRLAAAARRYAVEQELSNVQVLAGDVFDGPPPLGTFDFVHARFLAAVHGRGPELLREMLNLAGPGGVVAMQEPVANTWRCYPARPAWDRLIQTIATALGRAGGDLSAGQRTYRLFRRAGLEDVRVRAAVVALQDAHPLMRLPVLLAGALRRQILEGGLLEEAELDDMLRACETSALDGETFVTSFLVTQVWGRRGSAVPAHPYLAAQLQQGAGGAARERPRADVLPERHQEAVDLHPVPLGEHLLQGLHGQLRGAGLDVPPAVGHPVDVHVHPHPGHPAGDSQHQVGALGTDPGERGQDVEVAGHRAP